MPPSDRPSFSLDRTGNYTDVRTWTHLCLTILLTGAVTSSHVSELVNLNAQDARYGGSNGGDVWLGGPDPDDEDLSEWEPEPDRLFEIMSTFFGRLHHLLTPFWTPTWTSGFVLEAPTCAVSCTLAD
jgi:hypothetical protein